MNNLNIGFKASVIIPVYNAEQYIRKAVESAISLEEVGEVLLIEDKSPDNALAICRQLVKECEKVKLYQHPNGENRGAGASRNLGIQMAKFDFVAFLDADDYFLPNRFEKASSILTENPEIDGVYEPVGVHFYSTVGRSNFMRNKGLSDDLADAYCTNFKNSYKGEDVFDAFISGRDGHFCTDGIIVKKRVFEKAGIFDESLRLHQDTELWIRIAYYGHLVPGESDRPVAVRGVHDENRITRHRSKQSVFQFQKTIFDHFVKNGKKIKPKTKYNIIIKYLQYHPDVIKYPRGLTKYLVFARKFLMAYLLGK